MPVRSCRVDEELRQPHRATRRGWGFFMAPCSSDGMMLEINILALIPAYGVGGCVPSAWRSSARGTNTALLRETAASPGEIAMRCSSSWTGLSRRHSGEQDACEHPTERISQGTRMARCSSALAGDTLS